VRRPPARACPPSRRRRRPPVPTQLSHRGIRLHLFRSPDPARLNHPRIPHGPARATGLKFQISLASLLAPMS
jgi:hypothetical protein